MRSFKDLLHCDGRTDGANFQRYVALLSVARAALEFSALALLPALDARTVALGWLDPYQLIGPWMEGTYPTLLCAVTFVHTSTMVWHSVHRLRDMGWKPWPALALTLPYANVLAVIFLALAPTRRRSVWDLV